MLLQRLTGAHFAAAGEGGVRDAVRWRWRGVRWGQSVECLQEGRVRRSRCSAITCLAMFLVTTYRLTIVQPADIGTESISDRCMVDELVDVIHM